MRFQRPPFHHRRPERHEPPQADVEAELGESSGEEGVKREVEYLRHLTQDQIPVTVRLLTGEEFRGFIEYYDRRFIRLTRKDGPNLFIFKKDIKYLHEEQG